MFYQAYHLHIACAFTNKNKHLCKSLGVVVIIFSMSVLIMKSLEWLPTRPEASIEFNYICHGNVCHITKVPRGMSMVGKSFHVD